MPILSIHHLSVLVSDTKRALHFYRDLLGLEVIERPELSFPGAWLAIGDHQLHLLELPNPDAGAERPKHAGRDRHLALSVAGLDELKRRLTQAGIPVTHSQSGRNALFCHDPDGNGIELIATQGPNVSELI